MNVLSRLAVFAGIAGALAPAATALADEACPEVFDSGGTPCVWLRKEVKVYFNPEGLPTAEVSRFRRSLRLAIAVWNEEASTNLRLYYGGDTTDVERPGSIVVLHRGEEFFNAPDCGDRNIGAKAKIPSTEDPVAPEFCDLAAPTITVKLAHDCNGVVVPTVWAPYMTDPGDPRKAYTDMMIHELGHAGFDLLDTSGGDSVMDGVPANTTHAYLHPRDAACAIGHEGGPGSEPVTYETYDAGATWSSAVEIDPADEALAASTLGPGLAADRPGFLTIVGMTDPMAQVPILGEGVHGGWGDFSVPDETADAHLWVSIARSPYVDGPTMAVWLTGCNIATDCKLAWAWAPSYPAPPEDWVIGIVDGFRTFARPAIAYHPGQDRFVLVAPAAGTGTLQTAWSAANLPSWTVPSSCTDLACIAPVRYMGGLVFDPDPSSDAGLMTAGIDWKYSDSGTIWQYSVDFDAADNRFVITNAQVLSDANEFTWTSRHFGMSIDEPSETIMVAWANSDVPGGCPAGRSSDTIMVATKPLSEMDADFEFPEPISTGRCAYSSVDVAGRDGSFAVSTVLRDWAF